LPALPQGFQILDSSDQLSAVKRVIKAMNLDEERFVPKQVSWFIAGSKEEGQRPRDVEVRDEQTRKLVEVYQAYEDQCQREGVVDFAELMLRTYELMRDNARCASTTSGASRTCWSTSSRTPTAAVRWLKMFAPPRGAGGPQGVFAVGDDDQSIYAFRGARVGNMADFEREYRVRQVIKLEQNYRSCGHILDAANALIAHNSQRLGKNLRTDAGAGEPVRVHEAPATTPRRSGCSRRRSNCTAAAWRAARSPCSTAAMHRAACSRARCSTPACPTACTAACASSSAPRSSTRWPTCACWRTPTTTPASCAW
jgi:DNA helicase-2/ATP-dependent DNA helicase PcrA